MTEEHAAAEAPNRATVPLDAPATGVAHRQDEVDWDSEESFPASDPPGWAGSGGVTREAPPAGPRAAWTVENDPGQTGAVRDEDGGEQ